MFNSYNKEKKENHRYQKISIKAIKQMEVYDLYKDKMSPMKNDTSISSPLLISNENESWHAIVQAAKGKLRNIKRI